MTDTKSGKALDIRSGYLGPKDVGRAESLYQSALGKPDPDYSTHLLFSALIANPEHDGALRAILAKIPVYIANRRRMVVRVTELLGGVGGDAGQGILADAFIRSLASYCSSPREEEALACAHDAQRVGLLPHAVAMGERVLHSLDAGDAQLKSPAIARLIDLFDACGALDAAVRAARIATRLFPDDQSFREREKNLLATQYMRDTDLTSQTRSRDMLHRADRQETIHCASEVPTRIDELEHRYRQTTTLEDFRELVRALREGPAARREAALPVLEDGLRRFGDKETRWFVREIRIERQWAEVRLHAKLLEEKPASAALREEHESLRVRVLRDHVDHLYEVVSALPRGTPDRQRRQLELARRLFDAGRFEETIKQAQEVKARGDQHRLDAWVIMAKAFVRIGLIPEAGECFQQILAQLDASAASVGPEKVLEAKYAYAQFLAEQADRTNDASLARQARKLCADIMLEDIDYRDIRQLANRIDTPGQKGG